MFYHDIHSTGQDIIELNTLPENDPYFNQSTSIINNHGNDKFEMWHHDDVSLGCGDRLLSLTLKWSMPLNIKIPKLKHGKGICLISSELEKISFHFIYLFNMPPLHLQQYYETKQYGLQDVLKAWHWQMHRKSSISIDVSIWLLYY